MGSGVQGQGLVERLDPLGIILGAGRVCVCWQSVAPVVTEGLCLALAEQEGRPESPN